MIRVYVRNETKGQRESLDTLVIEGSQESMRETPGGCTVHYLQFWKLSQFHTKRPFHELYISLMISPPNTLPSLSALQYVRDDRMTSDIWVCMAFKTSVTFALRGASRELSFLTYKISVRTFTITIARSYQVKCW